MKSVAKVQLAGDEANDAGWRKFTVFEEILSSETPAPLLVKIETTCRQLNEVIQSGSASSKARAQAAMTAYGRSLDLLRLLTEVRDRAIEQQEQPRAGTQR